jgi:hypothetical protein
MNKKLEEWLVEVLNKKDWNAFNDIHIDQLDSKVKKAKWIKEGFFYFGELVILREKLAPKLLIALVFSLKGSTKYKGLNFNGVKEMTRELDSSPPSFYAFPKGFKPFNETIQRSLVIDNLYDVSKDNISLYYEYLLEGDDEFRRSIIFLTKKDFNRI